jgi:hypothetical protein
MFNKEPINFPKESNGDQLRANMSSKKTDGSPQLYKTTSTSEILEMKAYEQHQPTFITPDQHDVYLCLL